MGTSIGSDFVASFSDFVGNRSKEYEYKFDEAKLAALDELRMKASKRGGNAVVGTNIDCICLKNNMLGITLIGTVVNVEKCTVAN
jgi:uncharacterized protein YbjQ (UPF0145 family)